MKDRRNIVIDMESDLRAAVLGVLKKHQGVTTGEFVRVLSHETFRYAQWLVEDENETEPKQ